MYTSRGSRARRGGSAFVENDVEDSMNRRQSESGMVLGGVGYGGSVKIWVR